MSVNENEALIDGHTGKSTSAALIFSIWSTMIGSTMLAMPDIFRKTGLFPSIGVVIAVMLLNSYTANIFTRLGRWYDSTPALLRLLPESLRTATTVSSVLVFVGAMMLYHIYITQSLMSLCHAIPPHSDSFLETNAGMRAAFACGIAAVMFLVGMFRSLTPLFKASSYTIVIVIFNLCFIVIKSIYQISHDDCPADGDHGMGWLGVAPIIKLVSTLSVSLFVHTLVVELTRQSANQTKAPRDVLIAYVCTALSYGVPSGLAVYAFRHCDHFKGNFIEMFDDQYANVARAAISMQVGVIYPILLFIGRSQWLQIFYPTEKDVPYWAHLTTNFVFCGAACLPAVLKMETAVVAAAVGVCAILWTTLVPCVVKFKHILLNQETPSKSYIITHGAICAFGVLLAVATVLSLFEVY